MKLIRSATEQKTFDELVELQRVVSEHVHHRNLLRTLRSSFDDDVSFIALSFFPDGGDDFLELLVNTNMVVELDVPTTADGDVTITKQTPLKDYLVGKRRSQQIRLAVAGDIPKN